MSAGLLWSFVASAAFALDASKTSTGANHDAAQRYATGVGVTVGVFDTVPYGVPAPHHLGDRLLAQWSFVGKLPSQSPDPLISLVDDHERLAADIIAGDDPVNRGVAPGASLYVAAIDSTSFQSRRAASNWLTQVADVPIYSLSASFGGNVNGASEESLYWDWLGNSRDTLLVVAAGNSGGQLTVPADSYNGIAVGAYDQSSQQRWLLSAYSLNGGPLGSEVRGKPDILAPGVWIGDGISYDGTSSSGTSFAAPHVSGAAALLASYNLEHPAADALDHRALKALLLNSARKRQINGPESTSPVSYDSAMTSSAFDRDYLDCTVAPCTIQTSDAPNLTDAWSPAAWAFDGDRLSVSKPLDDEQGVGFLDAARAIVNLAGSNAGPGTVSGIGWDASAIAPTDAPAVHTYTLGQAVAAGAFLTATLVWDRIITEFDGNGLVNDVDSYSFAELANLDLRVLNATGAIVAESISTTDNVEHLHIPLPENAAVGDYKLQVTYNGGGALATDFALAWWTDPTPLVPGDYNLDGTVDAADYHIWRQDFGNAIDSSPILRGDGNGDGVVGAADYAIWRDHVGENWQGAVSLAQVPEPTTLLALMTFAAVAAGTLRIRLRDENA